MDAFWEILDPYDGHVIQRLAVLTDTEKDRLVGNGYTLVRRTLDRRIWRWLIEPRP